VLGWQEPSNDGNCLTCANSKATAPEPYCEADVIFCSTAISL
jgi:hypothetical protein